MGTPIRLQRSKRLENIEALRVLVRPYLPYMHRFDSLHNVTRMCGGWDWQEPKSGARRYPASTKPETSAWFTPELRVMPLLHLKWLDEEHGEQVMPGYRHMYVRHDILLSQRASFILWKQRYRRSLGHTRENVPDDLPSPGPGRYLQEDAEFEFMVLSTNALGDLLREDAYDGIVASMRDIVDRTIAEREKRLQGMRNLQEALNAF